jgi:hypothetical protein
MNMDYALCEALKYNMKGINRVLTFYDINCQYNKHFRERVDRNMYLEVDEQICIIPGIGLWHIHGHQDCCYVRYASSFIEGAGRIDGEIMETLWSPLNLISPSARGMSSPHRKECLDFQMNDSNFMKMIRMKAALLRKYKLAKRGVAESTAAFDDLNGKVPIDTRNAWEVAEKDAHARRSEDPTAMDIYQIKMDKGISFLHVGPADLMVHGSAKQKGDRNKTAR